MRAARRSSAGDAGASRTFFARSRSARPWTRVNVSVVDPLGGVVGDECALRGDRAEVVLLLLRRLRAAGEQQVRPRARTVGASQRVFPVGNGGETGGERLARPARRP